MRLTRHLKGSLSLRLVSNLTSPHTATRWLILQKARRHSARLLRLLVGARFQVLFHSPLGVLFTFPSRYSSTIGHRRVLSLGGWSPQLRTGFHVSGPTRELDRAGAAGSAYGALALFGRPFHAVPLPAPLLSAPPRARRGTSSPATPGRQRLAALPHARVWASVRFRSPLLAESRLSSFPPGT